MKKLTIALLGLGLLTSTKNWANQMAFVTEPFPPYSYAVSATDTTAAGPMAEVIQAVCAKLKVICHSTVMPWRRAYSMVVDGTVDGIFPIMPTDDRKPLLYFTNTIVRGAYTFFAKDNSHIKYDKPSDLDTLTVAVYGPSGTSKALDSISMRTTATIAVEVSNDTLLKKFSSGRYGTNSVFLMNRDVAFALLKQADIQGVKPAGDLMPLGYAIALSRKRVSQAQFDKFNDGIQSLTKDGTIGKILKKYNLKAAAQYSE